MSPTLRKEAEKQALAQGFSSLQEAVRFFLKKLAKGKVDIKIVLKMTRKGSYFRGLRVETR